MGRPTKVDAIKKKARSVSLTDAEHAKLHALGGSAWLSAMLTQFPENLQPMPPGVISPPGGGILQPPRPGRRFSTITK